MPRLGDPDRLAALDGTGLLDGPADGVMDRLTQLVCDVLDVPVALVSLVDDHRQVLAGQRGLGEPLATTRQTGLSHSMCQHVVVTGGPLVVTDAREDARVRESLAIPDLGVIAYAGMPLRSARGEVLGSLCAIDHEPRDWTRGELQLLLRCAQLAHAVIAEHEDRGLVLPGPDAEAPALARRLQRALMPRQGVAGGPQVASLHQPGVGAAGPGTALADVRAHADGTLGLLFGAVDLGGTDALALALTLRGAWAALEAARPELPALAAGLDDLLAHHASAAHPATASVLLVRTSPAGTATLLSAGHTGPVTLGARPQALELEAGPRLGEADAAPRTAVEHPVGQEGLLLFSPTLLLGRARPGSDLPLGVRGLLRLLGEVQARPGWEDTLLPDLLRAATAAHGDELLADLTLLQVR